jgi:hypothetical protein
MKGRQEIVEFLLRKAEDLQHMAKRFPSIGDDIKKHAVDLEDKAAELLKENPPGC